MAYYDSDIPHPAPYGTSRPPRQAGRSCYEPEGRRGRTAHNYEACDTEFDEAYEPYKRANGRTHFRSRRYSRSRSRSRSQRRTHSHSPSPSSRPPPSPEGPLPHDPVRDTSAVAYTYEEDEPASIPVAPAPWNGHSSSITKEALIAFLVDQGCHPKRAAAQVDREFSAHAVQWVVAGRIDPFVSRSEQGVRDPPRSRRFEASRERGDGDGGEGERRGTERGRGRGRERERDASPAYQPRRMPRAPSPPPASAYTRREHESQSQGRSQSSRSRRQRDCFRPTPSPVSSYHDTSPPPRPTYDYYDSYFPSSFDFSRSREPGAPRYQGAPWYEPPRGSMPREGGAMGWDRYQYEDMSREMDEMKRRMGEEKERRRY